MFCFRLSSDSVQSVRTLSQTHFFFVSLSAGSIVSTPNHQENSHCRPHSHLSFAHSQSFPFSRLLDLLEVLIQKDYLVVPATLRKKREINGFALLAHEHNNVNHVEHVGTWKFNPPSIIRTPYLRGPMARPRVGVWVHYYTCMHACITRVRRRDCLSLPCPAQG